MHTRWSDVGWVALVALLVFFAAPASAEDKPLAERSGVEDTQGWFVGVDGSLSLFSDSTERSVLGNSFGYGANVGRRWGIWGAYLHLEHNLWISNELQREVTTGAFNAGIGGEYHWHEGRGRTTLAAGPSILLFDTLLDDAGETGFFLELRPTGLRFYVGDLVITTDPITFTVVAPVLSGIPLVILQYRTVITVEFDL
jgi:hypothetical protein